MTPTLSDPACGNRDGPAHRCARDRSRDRNGGWSRVSQATPTVNRQLIDHIVSRVIPAVGEVLVPHRYQNSTPPSNSAWPWCKTRMPSSPLQKSLTVLPSHVMVTFQIAPVTEERLLALWDVIEHRAATGGITEYQTPGSDLRGKIKQMIGRVSNIEAISSRWRLSGVGQSCSAKPD